MWERTSISTMIEEARKLPLGHYGHKEARDIIEKEYGKCRVSEREFKKKIGLDLITVQKAFKLCNEILKYLLVRKLHSLKQTDKRYAYYKDKEIFLYIFNGQCSLTTVLHELTHHVMDREHIRGSHGVKLPTSKLVGL